MRFFKHWSRPASLLVSAILLIMILGSLGFLLKNKTWQVNRLVTGTAQSQSNKQASKNKETSKITWEHQDQAVKVPILMYHAIHVMDPSEEASANLIVDPATFESHVKALSEAGYYFLTPEEAYKVLTKNVLPNGNKKIVWMTFDDGDADFYSAYQIMKKYGARGTNNIITSFVDKEGFLTTEQIKEMAKDGMSFQSHTVNHPDLSTTDEASQETELEASKSWLDKTLNQNTLSVAYPSGRYSQATETLAKDKGYKMATTTNEGLASLDDGLLTLNRVRILPTTTAENLLETINWS